jgi:hypothetical protein
MKQNEIEALCDRAGAAVGTLPDSLWPTMVVRFLAALERKSGTLDDLTAYGFEEEILRPVMVEIEARMQLGGWGRDDDVDVKHQTSRAVGFGDVMCCERCNRPLGPSMWFVRREQSDGEIWLCDECADGTATFEPDAEGILALVDFDEVERRSCYARQVCVFDEHERFRARVAIACDAFIVPGDWSRPVWMGVEGD